jgi:hypothetical protein
MTAGLQVFRPNNTLQIDSDIKTLTLTAKVVASGWTLGSTVYSTTVVVPNTTVMLLFGNTSGSVVGIKEKYASGSSIVYRLWSNSTTAITCYGFGPTEITPANYGLQLFDAAGQLTFDATSKFLKIQGVTQTTSDIQSVPYSNPTGATIASGLSNYNARYIRNQIGQHQAFAVIIRGLRVGPSQIDSGLILNQGPATTTPPDVSSIGQLPTVITVDVTNY